MQVRSLTQILGDPHRLGSTILMLPILLLILMTLGEVAAGDVTGIQHLFEAAPLIVLLAFAQRHPSGAGILLLVVTVLLFTVWMVLLMSGAIESRQMSTFIWIVFGLVVFAPPILAAWCFLKTGLKPASGNCDAFRQG